MGRSEPILQFAWYRFDFFALLLVPTLFWLDDAKSCQVVRKPKASLGSPALNEPNASSEVHFSDNLA